MQSAEVVLRNAHIITVDARNSIAESIAIAGDKILAVGPDAAMAAHTAPATRVFDLKDRTIMPGLIDGHAHMDREALRNVFPGARQGPLDQGHPGPHRRARPQQEARRMDRHHADRRSALLLRHAGHPRREALADPAGTRRRRARTIRSSSARSGATGAARCRSCPAPTPRRSSAPASPATPSRRCRR